MMRDRVPAQPTSNADPHCWRWSTLAPMARRAGELVPVGRGGERRAIALANPGLAGAPYFSPTMWAAIQECRRCGHSAAENITAGTSPLIEREREVLATPAH